MLHMVALCFPQLTCVRDIPFQIQIISLRTLPLCNLPQRTDKVTTASYQAKNAKGLIPIQQWQLHHHTKHTPKSCSKMNPKLTAVKTGKPDILPPQFQELKTVKVSSAINKLKTKSTSPVWIKNIRSKSDKSTGCWCQIRVAWQLSLRLIKQTTWCL